MFKALFLLNLFLIFQLSKCDDFNGNLIHSITSGFTYVQKILVLPDGDVLINGEKEENVNNWGLVRKYRIEILNIDETNSVSIKKSLNLEYYSSDVILLPNGLLATSHENIIHVWDLATGSIVQNLTKVYEGRGGTMRLNFESVRSLALLDGNLVSGSGDGLVRIWNIKSGRVINSWQAYQEGKYGIDSLLVLKNGNLLTVGHFDGQVKIWNPQNGQLLSIVGDGLGPNMIPLSSGEIGGGLVKVHIWNPETLVTRLTIDIGEHYIVHGKLCERNGNLVSAKIAAVFSTTTGQRTTTLYRSDKVANSHACAFLHNGRLLMAADKEFLIYN